MSHTGQSAREKGDRALELHEKGVATDAISKARSRREKAKEASQ